MCEWCVRASLLTDQTWGIGWMSSAENLDFPSPGKELVQHTHMINTFMHKLCTYILGTFMYSAWQWHQFTKAAFPHSSNQFYLQQYSKSPNELSSSLRPLPPVPSGDLPRAPLLALHNSPTDHTSRPLPPVPPPQNLHFPLDSPSGKYRGSSPVGQGSTVQGGQRIPPPVPPRVLCESTAQQLPENVLQLYTENSLLWPQNLAA